MTQKPDQLPGEDEVVLQEFRRKPKAKSPIVSEGALVACRHFSHTTYRNISVECWIMPGPEKSPWDGVHECIKKYTKLRVWSMYVPGLWLGYLLHLLQDQECLSALSQHYRLNRADFWRVVNNELEKIRRIERKAVAEDVVVKNLKDI